MNVMNIWKTVISLGSFRQSKSKTNRRQVRFFCMLEKAGTNSAAVTCSSNKMLQDQKLFSYE